MFLILILKKPLISQLLVRIANVNHFNLIFFHELISMILYFTLFSGPLGDILGSFIFPSLVDIIGRKKTILLIAVPQIVSMTMIYFSYHTKLLLYTARFAGGLAEAACFSCLPLYIGEVSIDHVITPFRANLLNIN